MIFKLLVFRYVFFAIIATLLNLVAQRLILEVDDTSQGLFLAIAVGTFVGLATKYFLDKRWIFLDKSSGIKANSHKFMLYTIMGIVTTFIFWVFEVVFWLIWETDIMRELGAIIGLAIGYFIKYRLDSKFVFLNHIGKGRVLD